MIQWLTHLWRLLAALTVYRKVQPELDERERTPLPLPPGSPTEFLQTAPFKEPAGNPPEDEHHDEPHPQPVAPPPPVPLIDPVSTLAPLEVDDEGWLVGDGVKRYPTKRKGYKLRGEHGKVIDRPSGCLIHWTSTTWGTGLSMARRTMPDDGEGNWVHLWIEHDGTIYQSGSFHRGAPHAGAPSSKRMAVVDGVLKIVKRSESTFSANSFLVGVEVVCVGQVRRMKLVAGEYVKANIDEPGSFWVSWPYGKEKDAKGRPRGHKVPDDQVVDAVDHEGHHAFYQAYTPKQVEAIERIWRAQRAKYGFTDAAFEWGHFDVDPTRKSDPGGYFANVQRPRILARMRAS